MIKQISLLVAILFIQNAFCQVTFIVNKVPKSTTENQSIYISGDFEGWTGGQEKYKLTEEKGVWGITLPEQKGSINYKFTQGSWDTEELDTNGEKTENRFYTCKAEPETIYVTVENWGPKSTVVSSTAQKNVQILSEEFEIPQLHRKRKIWVYLPPDYNESSDNYPVLYMHDAQNIFDAKTALTCWLSIDLRTMPAEPFLSSGLLYCQTSNRIAC